MKFLIQVAAALVALVVLYFVFITAVGLLIHLAIIVAIAAVIILIVRSVFAKLVKRHNLARKSVQKVTTTSADSKLKELEKEIG